LSCQLEEEEVLEVAAVEALVAAAEVDLRVTKAHQLRL
jgi:hypothetical protein